MNRKQYIILTLFILTCIVQWYVLAGWMSASEQTRKNGVYIKIPCTQIDPVDPFRGTFLNINPSPGQFQFKDSLAYKNGQDIWINYTCDDSNRCTFYSVQPASEVPAESVYIRCKVESIYPTFLEKDSILGYSGRIIYPFTKYYVNEKEAAALNEKYNQAVIDTSRRVYAGMYVYKGEVVLDGIWVGNESLK
ncbi:MAG: GDYXXLXY domain-containing protein [Saprospiraceae bacterium]